MSSEPSSSTPETSRGRGRGRGNRGGLGKYLRARGRGRGGSGRPAVFNERLLLDGDKKAQEEEDEEAAAEMRARYSRRQLGTNADRYAEEEPELDSDGEPIIEPEVDLSTFLDRQRLADDDAPLPTAKSKEPEDDEDIDHSLAHISATHVGLPAKMKGKVERVDWTPELDQMTRDKANAEANWELRDRFRKKSDRLKSVPTSIPTARSRNKTGYTEAPALPQAEPTPPKKPKEEMEDFLDDLLS